MTVRDATADDIPWLAATAVAAYRTTFAPLLPHCDWTPFDDAHFRRRFAQDWPRMRILTQDGGAGLALPRGFTLVTAGHIDMVFLDEGARGQGLGAALLRDAQERGARSLETFAANLGARRFYERQGWRAVAESQRPFGGVPCDFLRYERMEPGFTASA